MRTIILALSMALVGCSSSNPVASDTEAQTAARTVQTVKLALLGMEQGFNDLGRYVVSGKIKNVSDTGISGISVNVTLKTSAGALIVVENTDPEHGHYQDLTPQGETTFGAEIWGFQLKGEIPDPSRTVIELLIDGFRVDYDDRTQAPYHDQFDFRFSNWGDDEETVASNEPGGFELDHVAGGKATKESYGHATGVLVFSDDIQDTVAVTYVFHGGRLAWGYYDFPMTAPGSRWDTIRSELTERYGLETDSDSSWPGSLLWYKGTRTWVFLYPPTTWRGIRIAYMNVHVQLEKEAEDEYNQLPLRVVVPDHGK